jgi:hypothetical protein
MRSDERSATLVQPQPKIDPLLEAEDKILEVWSLEMQK